VFRVTCAVQLLAYAVADLRFVVASMGGGLR
jgi:hypothetical protein